MHHLGRGVSPEEIPRQHCHHRRRLYRVGIRAHFPRDGRRGDAGLSRAQRSCAASTRICAMRCMPRWRRKAFASCSIPCSRAASTRATRSTGVMTSGETVLADSVMLAIGRRPNTAGLGLEAAGVADEAHRPYRSGPLFAHLGSQHLCRRRCHRPPRTDAGRPSRGDVLRARRCMEGGRRRPITSWSRPRCSRGPRSAPWA